MVFQEWTRWSDEGLVATQRQTLDELVRLDPHNPFCDAPGFVVLAEMPPDDDGTEATAERHFLPGVGMVREVAVTARGGHRITRQEMVRQADE